MLRFRATAGSISFPEPTCLLVNTKTRRNQFPETKILGHPVSRRMRGLVYMASRDKVEVDMFHKGIQYALEKLGKSKFGFERTAVSNFKSKRHEGSGNELVDYSRAPCHGADQKARGLWERDCGWMQPTYMRSVTFWGKFTSGSRISGSRSDLIKLPIDRFHVTSSLSKIRN